MNALEAEGLAGAGLTPAIERLTAACVEADYAGSFVMLRPEFVRDLASLLTRCRDTLEALSAEMAAAPRWQPISTAPMDLTPIILANFNAQCLLSGAPHVWTARYCPAERWVNGKGETHKGPAMWLECSYAATNENGEPTHWMPLPKEPS